MKRVFTASLAVALTASFASATDLNVSVKATVNDTNAITVAPGDPVEFYITADLSDDLNEGLALVGFNLHFTGNALASDTIDIPGGAISCGNPMPGFVKPDGITNPAGYGGTLIGDDLVQVGGAQNTILNTVANAAFPIGAVLTGIAQPAGCGTAVIATGSLTAPGEGIYELQLSELFANVIKDGETGDVFWATEAAGVGSVSSLVITVGGDVPVGLASASPACDSTLTRSNGNVVRFTFDGTVASTPVPGEIKVFALDTAGAFTGGDLSANFSFSLEAGDTVLRVEETGTAYSNVTWYGVVNDGAWSGVKAFQVDYVVAPGNVNGDPFTDFGDLSAIFANQTGAASDQNVYDINSDGFVDFGDLSAANAFIAPASVLPTKPSGHDCPQ